MAIHRSLGKITTPLSHLPTWFFIIGYPLFWLQLYTHSASDGVTSPLSWVLFGCVALLRHCERSEAIFLSDVNRLRSRNDTG